MLIEEFRIFNYKSYRASGPIQLSAGFNVFIGKNNGGKTALLEALSFSTLTHKPHRHSGIPSGHPPPPQSRVELTVTLTPEDLRVAFFSAGHFWFPVPALDQPDQNLALLQEFLQHPRSIHLSAHHGSGFVPSSYPSHGMFSAPSDCTVQFTVNEERNNFIITGQSRNSEDNVLGLVGAFATRSVYSFRAERLSLAAFPYGDTEVLLPNAQNLPVVLNVLQGHHERFARFNLLVSQVFPSIRRISVRPRGGNSEIVVWNADTPTNRTDLGIELAESGTGVGQVLAMLYIIVTSESPRTIIIDEPNIFLHPDAIRKLIEIMKADPTGHQYVITTHSPDIVRVTDAKYVYLVERKDEQSQIHGISPGELTSVRRTLLEVGARLSDVFGADNIVWVEGSTEEECFPKIIEAMSIERPPGLAVIAVRATGDFEGRRASAVGIWEIYHRLSTTGTLMPTTLAISLDREDRSEADLEKAENMSGGLLHFLRRRCFENYLIHPGAITAVLNTLPTFLETPAAEDAVQKWLLGHGGNARYDAGKSWNGDPSSTEWLVVAKGALILHDLFQALSDAKEEYRKVEHGAALTAWICENNFDHFDDLTDYIRRLINQNS